MPEGWIFDTFYGTIRETCSSHVTQPQNVVQEFQMDIVGKELWNKVHDCRPAWRQANSFQVNWNTLKCSTAELKIFLWSFLLPALLRKPNEHIDLLTGTKPCKLKCDSFGIRYLTIPLIMTSPSECFSYGYDVVAELPNFFTSVASFSKY